MQTFIKTAIRPILKNDIEKMTEKSRRKNPRKNRYDVAGMDELIKSGGEEKKIDMQIYVY